MHGLANASAMDLPTDPRFINRYIGLGYGFQIRGGCDGADVCEPGRDALKLFGGYRATPSLATEISYFYLGRQDKTWATGNPNSPTGTYIDENNQSVPLGTVSFESAKTHVLAVSAVLESELFPHIFHGRMMQHLRLGLAVSQMKKYQTWRLTTKDPGSTADTEVIEGAVADGQPEKTVTTKNRVFPHLGVGLSYGLTPHLRIFGSSDVLLNPDKAFLTLTFGAGGEF